MDPAHLNKLFSISNWLFLIPCYCQNSIGDLWNTLVPTCFSRHLRILRYEQLKEFSKLLIFFFEVLHREYWPCIYLYCMYFLQVFIPIYIYRIWETLRISRYINLSCLKFWFFTIDLLPNLIIVLWRTNFKAIPFEKKQCLQQRYCYSCLVVETKLQIWWLQSSWLYTSYIVLCQLWWSSFWRDDVASDDVSSGALSSDSFLQTHFFRRILPDALSFK